MIELVSCISFGGKTFATAKSSDYFSDRLPVVPKHLNFLVTKSVANLKIDYLVAKSFAKFVNKIFGC